MAPEPWEGVVWLSYSWILRACNLNFLNNLKCMSELKYFKTQLDYFNIYDLFTII